MDTTGCSVPFTRCLDAAGQPVGELPAFAHDRDALVALYRAMARTRAFDEKAVALQRTGRLGTYASSLGQEAVAVGVAAAMRREDVFLPSFREHGTQLWRGLGMTELLLYWGGDERGAGSDKAGEDFPNTVPVASHFPHAAGVALALQLRGQPRVAVATAGDGATSKGDFYEALNLVGVWRLPAVFVIANNQWAISVPRAAQTAAPTLAHKGLAAGVPGEQVDGNDVIAVRAVLERALARARAGAGGTLIEAVTYRLADHTTADDAARYRPAEEVGAHWHDEPVARLRQYLTAAHGWTRDEEHALLDTCRSEADTAAAAYLVMPPQPATSMFDHLYATLPAELVAQRAALGDG